MKKLYPCGYNRNQSSLLISCAPSSGSTVNDSIDTLSEKDIEVFQELLENKDSLTEEEIDSIVTNQFGKEAAEEGKTSVNQN